MAPSADITSHTLSRRAVLTGLATGVGAMSGCVDRFRTVMARNRPQPIALTIRAVPADDDPYSLRIARQLSKWFNAAGIDTSVQPMGNEALLRRVLVNRDFDLFVGRYPNGTVTPDSLYALLHSQFSAEPGWQNPFGYTHLESDDLLTSQRFATGDERRDTVIDLQHTMAQENPFTVLAFPDVIRAARSDRFDGFVTRNVSTAMGVLGLRQVDPTAEAVYSTSTDERLTTTMNPLVVAQHRHGTVTNLVFDPLVRLHEGVVYPWLAKSWEWVDDDTLDVTLRKNLSFHDGEALTAGDVAFTYEFLRDTSLGERDEPVPTMRYRGRSTLVESTRALDSRTARLTIGDSSRPVARTALTVPLLPRHRWRDRTGDPTVGGFDMSAVTTEALVTNNVPPVGSGPLKFHSASKNDQLVLERFDDHFLERTAPDSLPEPVRNGISFDRFVVTHVGSGSEAVELVRTGEADCTLDSVGPDVVRRIGRSTELDLVVDPSRAFYFLGLNVRQAPLANPHFRQLLARLVDRTVLVNTVFASFARSAISPLAGTEWIPEELAWTGTDPVTPFLGTAGTVDRERAHTAFRAAGYQYDESGRLLGV